MGVGLPVPPDTAITSGDASRSDNQVAEVWEAYYRAYELATRARIFAPTCGDMGNGSGTDGPAMVGYEGQSGRRCGGSQSSSDGSDSSGHRVLARRGGDDRQYHGVLQHTNSFHGRRARGVTHFASGSRRRFVDIKAESAFRRGVTLPVPPSTQLAKTSDSGGLGLPGGKIWLRYYQACSCIAGYVLHAARAGEGFESSELESGGGDIRRETRDPPAASVGAGSNTVGNEGRLSVRFNDTVNVSVVAHDKKRLDARVDDSKSLPSGGGGPRIRDGGLGNSYLVKLSPDPVPLDEEQKRARDQLKRAKKKNKERKIVSEVSGQALAFSEGLAELALLSSSGSDNSKSSFKRFCKKKNARQAHWIQSRLGLDTTGGMRLIHS